MDSPLWRENCFTLFRQLRKIKFNKMNKQQVKGNWDEQKGKLKQKFAVLTDNDLLFKEGKEDEMWGKVQKKVGKTKEELLKLIAAN